MLKLVLGFTAVLVILSVTHTTLSLDTPSLVAPPPIAKKNPKVTEINGTLTNEQGVPITEYTVLAFSTDPSFWQVQSRHIATARPDQTGNRSGRRLPQQVLKNLVGDVLLAQRQHAVQDRQGIPHRPIPQPRDAENRIHG